MLALTATKSRSQRMRLSYSRPGWINTWKRLALISASLSKGLSWEAFTTKQNLRQHSLLSEGNRASDIQTSGSGGEDERHHRKALSGDVGSAVVHRYNHRARNR